ncbi:MAG: 50S ribosomal protein L16 [Nanoarchaeota archaeon]
MVKLIRAVAWRRLERPYTRKSKYSKKNFVKAVPQNKIVKYDMGDPRVKYQYSCTLRSKEDIQIRHNAIESARKSSNKLLENKIGKTGYYMKVRIFPHHVLRNNPLASGAGADRMSTGMQLSFGKTVGLAARVYRNQPLFEIQVNKDKLDVAKAALKRAQYKVPCSCKIEVVELAK